MLAALSALIKLLAEALGLYREARTDAKADADTNEITEHLNAAEDGDKEAFAEYWRRRRALLLAERNQRLRDSQVADSDEATS